MFQAKAKAATKFAPAWHPNFRVAETLPDIGAVRAQFFVNAVAVLALLGMLAFNGQREFQAWSLQQEAADYEAKIAAGRGQNEAILKQNQTYVGLSRQAEELTTFMAAPLPVDDLLLALAENKPDELILDGISLGYREERINKKKAIRVPVVTVRGQVSGSSEEATAIFTQYKQTINGLPLFAERIEAMREFPERDEELKVLTFQLKLELSGGKEI